VEQQDLNQELEEVLVVEAEVEQVLSEQMDRDHHQDQVEQVEQDQQIVFQDLQLQELEEEEVEQKME
jgi:hypothetical protein